MTTEKTLQEIISEQQSNGAKFPKTIPCIILCKDGERREGKLRILNTQEVQYLIKGSENIPLPLLARGEETDPLKELQPRFIMVKVSTEEPMVMGITPEMANIIP